MEKNASQSLDSGRQQSFTRISVAGGELKGLPGGKYERKRGAQAEGEA